MADTFTIAIPDLASLLEDVAAAGGNAQPLAQAALRNSATLIQSKARALAPHRTGNLQRSILSEVTWPDAKVSVNEVYGTYVEEGTGLFGPYKQRIFPKSAKALRWTQNGVATFARSIKGMKAQPYFSPAVMQSIPLVEELFTGVVDRLTQELAGRA